MPMSLRAPTGLPRSFLRVKTSALRPATEPLMVSMSTHQSEAPQQYRRAPRYPLWGLLLGLAVNLTACRQEELSPSSPKGHGSSTQPVIDVADKPNIVVIMTDDEQVADMHVMSHTLA